MYGSCIDTSTGKPYQKPAGLRKRILRGANWIERPVRAGKNSAMQWNSVLPGVWMYRDSCNVYAVEGRDGMLLVNAGTGRWLDSLGELPGKPAALLCTHYFRDHSSGALPASRASTS